MRHFRRSTRRAALALVLSVVPATGAVAASAAGPSNGSGARSVSGEIEEIELTMASFLSPTTAQGAAITWWIDELAARTDGRVTVETFWDASLLGAQDIAAGVRDGRVALGNMTYAYTPNDFPLTSMVEIPFLGDNLAAQTLALNEVYAANEDFRNEWEGQGIKVLSFIGIPPALTGASEQVDSVEWYENKTVRASGFFVTAVEAAGGSAAPLPVNDVYEAMQRGTIDAYGGLILDVIAPLRLYEVGDQIHDPGLGHYANSTWVMSLDQWEELSPELQAIIEELNAEFPTQLVEQYQTVSAAACETILDAGGSVLIFGDDQVDVWRELVGDEPLTNWIAKAEDAGVADAQALYDSYVSAFQAADAEVQYSPMAECVGMQEERG
jgi:TRAP-type C4-dicarboxylate transport system substrate-binding protein